jgi:hypothetical protein
MLKEVAEVDIVVKGCYRLLRDRRWPIGCT